MQQQDFYGCHSVAKLSELLLCYCSGALGAYLLGQVSISVGDHTIAVLAKLDYRSSQISANLLAKISNIKYSVVWSTTHTEFTLVCWLTQRIHWTCCEICMHKSLILKRNSWSFGFLLKWLDFTPQKYDRTYLISKYLIANCHVYLGWL